MRVVELMGAPCSGKSTVAMGLVYMLRQEGYKAELVTEVAKDLYWEGTLQHLPQDYITRDQILKVEAVASHQDVDFVICDSSVSSGEAYATQSSLVEVGKMIDSFYKKIRTKTFFIDCNIKYTPTGRLQTASDALELKRKIRRITRYHGDTTIVQGVSTSEAVTIILDILLNRHYVGKDQ